MALFPLSIQRNTELASTEPRHSVKVKRKKRPARQNHCCVPRFQVPLLWSPHNFFPLSRTWKVMTSRKYDVTPRGLFTVSCGISICLWRLLHRFLGGESERTCNGIIFTRNFCKTCDQAKKIRYITRTPFVGRRKFAIQSVTKHSAGRK